MYRSSIRPVVRFLGLVLILAAPPPPQAFGWGRESPALDRGAARFIEGKLHVWQTRMNLKDWDIRFELVRADRLEPKTLGNIHWDTDIKAATIAVLSPEDYTISEKAMLDDMEFTIVHELVHLQLASLPRSEASRRVEEHAVNEIATALLKLARR
jgi:hypothetical protein